MRCAGAQAINRRLIKGPHNFTRRAHDKRAIGNFLALGDKRPCPDKTIFPDLRPVQHGCPHTDQAIVANRAAMKHHLMPNGTARADG